MLTLWYVGFLLRAGLLVRVAPWVRLLPSFFALILTYLIQSAGNQYWLHDNPRANEWTNLIGPIYCGVRLLVYIEACRWFSAQLPRFRTIGYWWLGICALAGAAIQLRWQPEAVAHPWQLLASMERITGIGVAAALTIAWLGYSAIRPAPDRMPQFRAASWHAVTMALWSLGDGLGWLQIHKAAALAKGPERLAAFNLAGYIIIGAAIVCPLLWLAMVRTPPRWKEPEPVGTREEAEEAIRNMGRVFER